MTDAGTCATDGRAQVGMTEGTMVLKRWLGFLLAFSLIVAAAGCATRSPGRLGDLPTWQFTPAMIFPADRSLMRPEAGVVLPDGRLLVADQAHGLRLLMADGSSRPFGAFKDAGYEHVPPHRAGGANGVTLDPSGRYAIVADVLYGVVYRTDVVRERTERLYRHEFGVNMARVDSRGGLWFTQSTRNQNEEELWRSVAKPVADGAVYYVAPAREGVARIAVKVADGFFFANGLALDERAGVLYLAETLGSRILKFHLDVANGRLSDMSTVLKVWWPDNIELDGDGQLWIASPLRNEIVVADPGTGVSRSVFRITTPRSEELVREAEVRAETNRSVIDVIQPAMWEPGPGLLTGMILSPGNGPVYATTLGNALIRLPR
jgi:sugar lactone lactonase YvrE